MCIKFLTWDTEGHQWVIHDWELLLRHLPLASETKTILCTMMVCMSVHGLTNTCWKKKKRIPMDGVTVDLRKQLKGHRFFFLLKWLFSQIMYLCSQIILGLSKSSIFSGHLKWVRSWLCVCDQLSRKERGRDKALTVITEHALPVNAHGVFLRLPMHTHHQEIVLRCRLQIANADSFRRAGQGPKTLSS